MEFPKLNILQWNIFYREGGRERVILDPEMVFIFTEFVWEWIEFNLWVGRYIDQRWLLSSVYAVYIFSLLNWTSWGFLFFIYPRFNRIGREERCQGDEECCSKRFVEKVKFIASFKSQEDCKSLSFFFFFLTNWSNNLAQWWRSSEHDFLAKGISLKE